MCPYHYLISNCLVSSDFIRYRREFVWNYKMARVSRWQTVSFSIGNGICPIIIWQLHRFEVFPEAVRCQSSEMIQFLAKMGKVFSSYNYRKQMENLSLPVGKSSRLPSSRSSKRRWRLSNKIKILKVRHIFFEKKGSFEHNIFRKDYSNKNSQNDNL